MNKKIFVGIGVFWLAIALGFVAVQEYTLQTGEEVILKTRPVDPRDLFRGDYVILNYEISRVSGTEFDEGDAVYVSLEKSNGYASVIEALHEKPGGFFIKGEVKSVSGETISIDYGIESYFVPEGQGWDIQRQRSLEVKVAIDNFGRAKIKHLLVDGEKVEFE